MEIKNKSFSEILYCPLCHSSLLFRRKKITCTNKKCSQEFLVKNGISIFLTENLINDEDYQFKKEQINFFDRWSSEKRGKVIPLTSFDRFFSGIVGEKRINYSEDEMSEFVQKLPKNSLVLELGCGAGEHTAFLAGIRKDMRLIAIDISFKSILETKKRLNRDNNVKCQVDFMAADAECLPLKDNILDGVIAVMFFHHVASPEKSLREAKRIIKDKGLVLLVDLVGNNPLVMISRRCFVHLPSFLKERFKKDYFLEGGQIPEVKLHRIERFKRIIEKLKFNINRESRYELFISSLSPLATVCPFIKYLFTEKFLNFLYNVEKKLLKDIFFQKFAGAVSLWLSK